MTAWWQKAYPGGPMVGPPLARPLYPPDASKKGKTPSPAGADAEAVKRALWRGGRWPGPASGFDQAYSNGVAHGRGPNVIDSGLAGFQRAQKIDASGWMGEATYNALRSARIPEPLPNAGQPLFDATAVALLESYRAEQAGGPGSTLRAAALAKAKTYLGYTESPPGTNGNIFGEWYGMQYEPWCAMFVSYCFEHVGDSPSFAKGSSYAYCPFILSDARAGRNGLAIVGEPEPGDLALYDWSYGGDGEVDHVGFFEAWTGGRTFNAIEGNTAVGNDSNGGQVMRRSRDAGGSSGPVYFVRVREP